MSKILATCVSRVRKVLAAASRPNSAVASVLVFGALVCALQPAVAQFNQQAELVGIGAIGAFPQQGWAVALSEDGNTAIVGAKEDDQQLGIGAAWIWTQSGGVWTQQAKLVATDNVGASTQGWSVALSANGNTGSWAGLATMAASERRGSSPATTTAPGASKQS